MLHIGLWPRTDMVHLLSPRARPSLSILILKLGLILVITKDTQRQWFEEAEPRPSQYHQIAAAALWVLQSWDQEAMTVAEGQKLHGK